ncbi:DUF2894 domain-containing protein [Pseudoxanthomonas winnipegensis]|uniref:DUF2894 domain-containing protein n=1 Tax=Pseudoxanthomonas winnipegensis TaxID=2480810 RepID=A0A4Q8M1N2_9GAMM|nr:DUF2894 domain-containing protein [Pseudoxanthomonas winnipegensis]TAA40179.1 DUF2894 domain-containing protein [Pseudoxanthomonas winnipegensis]
MQAALGQLERWRAQGADRIDPVRFALLDALAARTQAQTGATRALLEARLAALLAEYRTRVEQARARKRRTSRQAVSVASPLAELLDALHAGAQQRFDARDEAHAASPSGTRAGTAPDSGVGSAADAAALPPAATRYPQLPALDEFQRLWEEVRTARQLRQSLEPAPEDSGPLNSHLLVHRALTLMHDTAPGYLQHFLGYVDTLSWMAQLQGGTDPEADAPRLPSGAKPPKSPRSRARKKPA